MKFLVIAAIVGLLAFTNTCSGAYLSIKQNDTGDLQANATSAANTDKAQDLNLAAALLQLYKAFQAVMPCGLADADIPPLAPFKIDFYEYNVDTDFVKIKGDFANLVISGLNNFNILNLFTNNSTGRTYFDVNWFELQTLAEYKNDFWALIAGYPYETKGDGIINTKIDDIRIVGDFVLSSSSDKSNGTVMSDFHINFYLGDVHIDNWNKFWDIAGNNFINKLARDVIIYYAQQTQGDVLNDIFNTLYVPIVNSALKDISISELIKLLQEYAQLLQKQTCTKNSNV